MKVLLSSEMSTPVSVLIDILFDLARSYVSFYLTMLSIVRLWPHGGAAVGHLAHPCF